MKKSKNQKSLESALIGGDRGVASLFDFLDREQTKHAIGKKITQRGIVLLGVTGANTGNQEKPAKLKLLNQKEKETVAKETKKALLTLTALPTPPYSSIIPSPGLSKLNPLNLCAYVSDKFPRISVITAMADCVPSVTDVEAICTSLLPLASMNYKDVTTADRAMLNTLDTQLRQNFMTMINSCATLANGNLPLFALTGVAVRQKGVHHNEQLAATVFKLNTTKGTGKVGVSCKAIKYAKNYIVYYGKGTTYDAATWHSQIGTSRQIISGLTPGEMVSFIMVAIGKKQPGLWAPSQGVNVPYN